jgi:hypothetical protein
VMSVGALLVKRIGEGWRAVLVLSQ